MFIKRKLYEFHASECYEKISAANLRLTFDKLAAFCLISLFLLYQERHIVHNFRQKG